MNIEIPKYLTKAKLTEFIKNHIQTNYPDLPLYPTVLEIIEKIYAAGYENIREFNKSAGRTPAPKVVERYIYITHRGKYLLKLNKMKKFKHIGTYETIDEARAERDRQLAL